MCRSDLLFLFCLSLTVSLWITSLLFQQICFITPLKMLQEPLNTLKPWLSNNVSPCLESTVRQVRNQGVKLCLSCYGGGLNIRLRLGQLHV